MTTADANIGSASLRVLGFAGSLRAGSFNRALLRAARELPPAEMHIDIHDLIDVPLYNGDVEQANDRAPVTALKREIREADALLIATPEYSHGVPGVLNNAIDWVSRPPGKSPLEGKLAAIIGASPGMTGSARAQTQLRQAFNFTNTYAMLQPEVLVARAHVKFDAEGHLTDETTRKFLQQFLGTFLTWAKARLPVHR